MGETFVGGIANYNGTNLQALAFATQYANDSSGIPVGQVLANDTDAGTTFSQWRIESDPTEDFAIDPATGVISLQAGRALDFEFRDSYTITVSVFDGYTRSAPGTVTIKVTNDNDNAPVVQVIQNYAIDATYEWIGRTKATDFDDSRDPGFTQFSDWRIVGGDAGGIFAQDPATGNIRVAQPLAVDFSRSRYTILVTVSDGVNTSAPQAQTITIPNKVQVCKKGVTHKVNKLEVTKWLREGAGLGPCKR